MTPSAPSAYLSIGLENAAADYAVAMYSTKSVGEHIKCLTFGTKNLDDVNDSDRIVILEYLGMIRECRN